MPRRQPQLRRQLPKCGHQAGNAPKIALTSIARSAKASARVESVRRMGPALRQSAQTIRSFAQVSLNPAQMQSMANAIRA
ncbi:MAG: hypothetical protein ABJ311_08860, partial [Erythrobacter sp.]